MEDTSPSSLLEFLATELADNTPEVRAFAAKKLRVVAEALGVDAAREQLIPFLAERIGSSDDEQCMIFAKHLGDFLPLIGGPEHASPVLDLLSQIAGIDAPIVRETAAEAVNKIVAELTPETSGGAELQTYLVGYLQALADHDWFPYRVSACQMLKSVLPHLTDEEPRAEGMTLFDGFVSNDSPAVRRAVAAELTNLARVMSGEEIQDKIVTAVGTLSNDDQPSVRVVIVEQCAGLSALFHEKELVDDAVLALLPIAKAAVEDKSWRVRHAISKEFVTLCRAYGATVVTEQALLTGLVSLVQDEEGEVRQEIAPQVVEFVDIVGPEPFATTVLPGMYTLSQDMLIPVRCALSEMVATIAGKLTEADVTAHAAPLLRTFLADQAPEVRLRILSRIDLLAKETPDLAQQLMPTFQEACADEAWRIRRAMIEALPAIAEHFGVELFAAQFSETYLAAFEDAVAEVRTMAADMFPKVAGAAGSDWLQRVLPRVRALLEPNNFYLIRINVMTAIGALLSDDSIDLSDDLVNEFVSSLVHHTTDDIANIRMASATVISKLANAASGSQRILARDDLKARLREAIDHLAQSDADTDVKYFAARGVEQMA